MLTYQIILLGKEGIVESHYYNTSKAYEMGRDELEMKYKPYFLGVEEFGNAEYRTAVKVVVYQLA